MLLGAFQFNLHLRSQIEQALSESWEIPSPPRQTYDSGGFLLLDFL